LQQLSATIQPRYHWLTKQRTALSNELYMPTGKELATELQRERQTIEMEGRFREETDED
jgi:hypothetical protein